MHCHYEVLAVARDASTVEIKKAFRQQALRWHPDKHQQNGISNEEATKQFQTIQSAYEVLSDPHEKKWYDEHREQIIRSGESGNSMVDEDKLDLFRYYRASVYSGFGSDVKSFYNVYGELFNKIDGLDLNEGDGSKSNVAPGFGDAETSMDAIHDFYQHWKSYTTQRSFAWVDEYKTTDAPTRLVRRAMEKENKKLREAAKKAFTTEVRELVNFVHRRDPRVGIFRKQKELENHQRRINEETRKREKQAAFRTERDAFQKQQVELWGASSGDTSRLADRDIELELETRRKKMDADVLVCGLCSKTFKSTKQLQNHLTSKKHREKEVELGVFSNLSSLDEDIETALLEQLEQAKIDLNNDDYSVTPPITGKKDKHDAKSIDSEPQKADEELAQTMVLAERARLKKELKAAEKRRERKEARKNQKKEIVEKIVNNARSKREQEKGEGQRRRGKKEKKRKEAKD